MIQQTGANDASFHSYASCRRLSMTTGVSSIGNRDRNVESRGPGEEYIGHICGQQLPTATIYGSEAIITIG